MICCLGWGSLIWNPANLALREPVKWHEDGPILPVEFARKSINGRITLVILAEGLGIPVLWAQMNVPTLEDARNDLAEREGTLAIGHWPSKGRSYQHGGAIGAWASARGIDGVIWTALPTNVEGAGSMETGERIVEYLRSLSEPALSLAMEYVRKTPAQVRTPYRAIIEREFPSTTQRVSLVGRCSERF